MRRVVLLGLVAAALVVPALPSAAAGPRVASGRLLGMVRPRFGPHGIEAARSAPDVGPTRGNDVTYHGGPVMRTNTVYAIYWLPSGYADAPNYRPTIDQYFRAVAHDSAATTNVYSVATQYSDTAGEISYDSTFGGAAIDTDPFPANTLPAKTCRQEYPGATARGVSVCLRIDSVSNEVRSFANQEGWPHGPNTIFFLYTPPNVGSCEAGQTGGECSYFDYCAFHSWFWTTPQDEYLYAYVPWPEQSITADGKTLAACDIEGEHPNGTAGPSESNAADDAINLSSHEQNETISDPSVRGWYTGNPLDLSFDEMADLCEGATVPASALPRGSPSLSSGLAYDQVIDGHHYFVQGEWSNHSATSAGFSGCVWNYPYPVNTQRPAITGDSAVGDTLTGHAGSWAPAVKSYTYVWLRCGVACVDVQTTTSASPTAGYTITAADALHKISLVVSATNAAGTSADERAAPSGLVPGKSRTSVLWTSTYAPEADPSNVAQRLATSPDGKTIYIAGSSSGQFGTLTSNEPFVAAYDAKTGSQKWAVRYAGTPSADTTGCGDGAWGLAASPDGQTVFVSGDSCAPTGQQTSAITIAYNASNGAVRWIARDSVRSLELGISLVARRNSKRVYVGVFEPGDHNSRFRVLAYNASNGKRIWVSSYGTYSSAPELRSIALSPDGSTIVATGNDSQFSYTLTVAFRASDGAELWSATGPGIGRTIAFSPNGRLAFVSAVNDTIAYNLRTGAQTWEAPYPNGYTQAIIASGSRVYVTGGSPYATIAYDAATGSKVWEADQNGPPGSFGDANAIALSPDGKSLYVTGSFWRNGGALRYQTIAYSTATGARRWFARYNSGITDYYESATAVAALRGEVVVTGFTAAGATTIAYSP